MGISFRWKWGGRPREPVCPGPTQGPLSTWQAGETAVVLEVPGASPLASRLRELGVVPGALVRVLRAGCPLVFQVGGGRFCLRKRDAANIRVGAVSEQSMAKAAG